MKNRVIALILALSMLFGLASCAKSDELPPKDKYLTVEVEAVEYNDGDIDEAALRVADIAEDFVTKFYNRSLGEARKAEVISTFKTDIYQALLDIGIYKHELFAMIECMEECLTYSTDIDDRTNRALIADLYVRWNRILDSDRLGALIFELQMLSLESTLEDKKEKYDKYGYGYYLEDVEYYTGLIERANALGRQKFADALSVLTFMVSSLVGMVEADTGNIKLAIGDIFVIMEKQGERFVTLDIGDSDWQVVAEMCEVFIPTNPTSDMRDKMLTALGDDDFFVNAATLMPDIIAFYRAITDNISQETIDMIESEEELAYARAFCSELLNNKEALSLLLDSISEEMPCVGAGCLSVIKAYDRVGYEAFCETDTSDKEGVISSLETFAENPTEDSLDAVREELVAFIAGINPVVAYVYLYK